MQPAVDYITNSSVGPFLDTGRNIKFGDRIIGRLYISKSSVEEMAREFGLLGRTDSVAVEQAYNQGKLDGLREELGGDLYSIADTLRRWLDHVAPSRVVAADSSEEG